ncbi:MAG TPA: NADH-quinone oxidoreductase subunit C [Spirochaetota bacterium]|nr:NADH-quinone oxidoreductase subunit C [Spirochaetota bacterium]HPJ35673.1 NADH-quinone oxidoreductase subunit C [Spirochaetota bacterium]
MNSLEQVLKTLNDKFGGSITGHETPLPTRLFVDIKAENVREISNEVVALGGRYLVGIGYDNIARDGNIGMIHSFGFDKDNFIVHLRTAVPESNPVMPSITPDIPGAGWSEREYQDLLGMKFEGHPKPKRLVVADDWPSDIYPMRKEVPYNLVPPGAEDVAYQLDECPEGCSIIPVGPFHTALHEPEHFAVYVDGETIKGCDYRGFMTHRGIEKLCESQVSYNEVPFIAERICGICGSVHATAYSQSVEMAGGIPVPERAKYIRSLLLEIERLHSHLLWLGVAGHLIGFDTVFMQSWRVREQIMWLSERITGNRKTYGMVIVGGVRRDITPEIGEDILNVCRKVEEEVKIIHKSITGDTALHKRTKGVGYLSKEEAINWSLVGPVARARGIDIDVRRDHPYAAYSDLQFDVPVVDTCDVWGTLVVRLLEIYESIRIIRQIIPKMPKGELLTELDAEIPPFKHGISVVEAPRGESVHFVITGEENRPDRWRVRAPTYPNLQAIPAMLLNDQFADFPIIVGSIDPCFSCTDRVEVVNITSGQNRIMSKSELEFISRGNK